MKPHIKTPLINLTCLVCLFISSKGFSFFNAPQNGELIITEVVIADNSAYSFIELRNNTESDLELSGVQLKDNTKTTLYTFGSGTLTPGGLIVLTNASDKFTFESNWGTLNGDVLFIVASNNLNITNAQVWSLEKDITIDEATIGASGQYFLRDLGISELINTNSNNTASPGELDLVFNGNTDISVLSNNTAAVNVFFNTNTSLPDTQIAAINNMHIASGASLTINGGLTVNGEATNQGQLVVSSDENSSGSLIANNQVGDLELTYERYVIGSKWNSICPPVENVTVLNIVENGNLTIRPSNTDQRYLAIFNYDVEQEWPATFNSNLIYYNITGTGIDNNTIINESNPVMLNKNNTDIFEFTGNFKNSDSFITLKNNTSNTGWHFLGNPYPSFISVAKFIEHNNNHLLGGIENSIYIFDYSRFLWRPMNASGNQYIAPGQAFFVKTKTNGGNIEITKNMLEHSSLNHFGNNSIYLKKENKIRLRMTGGNSIQRYLNLFYSNEASDGIDENLEATFFKGHKLSDYEIFSYPVSGSNERLTIQNINENRIESEHIIPIGILTPNNGKINISLNSDPSYTENDIRHQWTIILEDKQNNTFTNLTDGNNLILENLEKIDGGNRFYLHISKEEIDTLSIENKNNFNLKIYKFQNHLFINGLSSKEAEINIYDINGKVIFESKNWNLDKGINLDNKDEILIINIKSKNTKVTKKIII